MITRNYETTQGGTLVASGEGVVTMTPNFACQWAIGDSDTMPPSLSVRHSAGGNVSMTLAAGEHLWVYGAQVVAVTAENPAAGNI